MEKKFDIGGPAFPQYSVWDATVCAQYTDVMLIERNKRMRGE